MNTIEIPRQHTGQLADTLSRHLRPGDVVGLCGPLGAGKTTLVKLIAKKWKIKATVTSPTFSLIQVYEGKDVNIYHIDLYRMDSAEEAVQAGVTETFVDPKGIVFIEWADKFPEILPEDSFMIKLQHTKQ